MSAFLLFFSSWLFFCEGGDQTSNTGISSTLSEFIPSSDKTDADGLAVVVVRTLEFTEIALVLVRFDHVASFTVNANHRIVTGQRVGSSDSKFIAANFPRFAPERQMYTTSQESKFVTCPVRIDASQKLAPIQPRRLGSISHDYVIDRGRATHLCVNHANRGPEFNCCGRDRKRTRLH